MLIGSVDGVVEVVPGERDNWRGRREGRGGFMGCKKGSD